MQLLARTGVAAERISGYLWYVQEGVVEGVETGLLSG
jgi:hypothetical protein